MKIDVLHISKIHLLSKLESGFSIPVDGAVEMGGQNLGARPMELFLTSLASCSGFDVLIIMQKSKCQVHSFHIEVTGNRRNEIPKHFESIHLIFHIKADGVSEKQLNRAINLSVEKYCSVRAMIKESVKITYELNLIQD